MPEMQLLFSHFTVYPQENLTAFKYTLAQNSGLKLTVNILSTCIEMVLYLVRIFYNVSMDVLRPLV